MLRQAQHDKTREFLLFTNSSTLIQRANGLVKDERNNPMLGATGEDFSLARAPHIKTNYCINQDYPAVCY